MPGGSTILPSIASARSRSSPFSTISDAVTRPTRRCWRDEREESPVTSIRIIVGDGAANAAAFEAHASALRGKAAILFQGETLRGLLVTSGGLSIFGDHAHQAALVCFAVALVLLFASIAGFIHAFRTPRRESSSCDADLGCGRHALTARQGGGRAALARYRRVAGDFDDVAADVLVLGAVRVAALERVGSAVGCREGAKRHQRAREALTVRSDAASTCGRRLKT